VCGSTRLETFLELQGLPALCNALWADATEAAAAATGDVTLAVCPDCGMITNVAFDPGVFGYSPQYENSLHFSPAFQRYADEVAHRLVDRYGLHGIGIMEIGPGTGDFLALLCQLGDNHGVGYDPSHDPARIGAPDPRVDIVAEPFPTDGSFSARLVCARHVLEHVPDAAPLLASMRRALDGEAGVAYVEVPDGAYLLDNVALWDVIYEHCHHYTPSAMRRQLSGAGFAVHELGSSFGDQFLWAEAGPAEPTSSATTSPAEVAHLVEAAHHFAERALDLRRRAAEVVQELSDEGPVVLWGAGSKGVSFVNMVEGAEQIRELVDINPHKRGRFVPLSAHPVVGPADLAADPPATALVLNPNYLAEIGGQLEELGVPTRVASL
jgi:SAM-dependent methyltransferase